MEGGGGLREMREEQAGVATPTEPRVGDPACLTVLPGASPWILRAPLPSHRPGQAGPAVSPLFLLFLPFSATRAGAAGCGQEGGQEARVTPALCGQGSPGPLSHRGSCH